MLLVVWGHVIQYLGYPAWLPADAGRPWGDPLFKTIYLFHMPLFMAISGYLCSVSLQRKAGVLRIPRSFVRLCVPAIAWYLVLRAGIYLWRLMSTGDSSPPAFLPPVHIALSELFLQGWFVWCVFAFGLILLLLRLCRIDRWPALLCLSLLCSWLPDGAMLFLAQFTFPFFCAGYLAPRVRVPAMVSRPWFALLLFVPVAGAWTLWAPEHFAYNLSWSGRDIGLSGLLFRYGVGGLASLLALLLLLRLRTWPLVGRLDRLGRHTLLIYLVQGGALMAFSFLRLPLQGGVLFSVFIAPAIALGLCLLLRGLGTLLEGVPILCLLLAGRRQAGRGPGPL